MNSSAAKATINDLKLSINAQTEEGNLNEQMIQLRDSIRDSSTGVRMMVEQALEMPRIEGRAVGRLFENAGLVAPGVF
jgi:hypothetical protein